MDNKFQEFNDIDIISGNLTAFMSDHVPQFALTSNILGKNISSKSNIHEKKLVQIWTRTFYSWLIFYWLGGFGENWWNKFG